MSTSRVRLTPRCTERALRPAGPLPRGLSGRSGIPARASHAFCPAIAFSIWARRASGRPSPPRCGPSPHLRLPAGSLAAPAAAVAVAAGLARRLAGAARAVAPPAGGGARGPRPRPRRRRFGRSVALRLGRALWRPAQPPVTDVRSAGPHQSFKTATCKSGSARRRDSALGGSSRAGFRASKRRGSR